MNEHRDDGFEIDAELEAGLRDDLRRDIVPPPTPAHLREAVEMMAADHGRRTRAPRKSCCAEPRPWRAWPWLS